MIFLYNINKKILILFFKYVTIDGVKKIQTIFLILLYKMHIQENDDLPMRHLINFMQWKIAGKEEEHEFFKKESIC